MNKINIAIDGPAGAGKSTIARRIAEKNNYIYVDTGAMYRTMGLYFLKNKIDILDESIVEKYCESINISIKYEYGVQQLYLNGENVTPFIRTEEVGNMASACAKNNSVRKKITALSKTLANLNDVVMDGRDIGTTVLPNAPLKIFLTASASERAKRRTIELKKKGVDVIEEQILQDIISRDLQDSTRKYSPLKQAEDAVVVDSSNMEILEVVEAIQKLIDDRIKKCVK